MSTKTWMGLVFSYLTCLSIGVAFMLLQTPVTWSDIVTAQHQEPFVLFLFLPMTGGLIIIAGAFYFFLIIGFCCVLIMLGTLIVATWKRKFNKTKHKEDEEDEEEEQEEES